MKNLNRIIIACLICSLLFGIVSMPVRVEASALATMAVTFGGVSATVSAPIVLGIILLIASGYVISTLPQLIDDVTEWVNYVPGFMDYLEEQVETGISDLTVVYIPEFVQKAMQKKAQENGKEQPDKQYIYLPPEFHQLDKLSQAQLLGEDVVSELKTGNWLTQSIKNLSSNMLSTLQTFQYNVESVLNHIPDSLTTLRTQFVSKADDIKTSVQSLKQNFASATANISQAISSSHTQTISKFDTFSDLFKDKFEALKTVMSATRENLTDIRNSINGFIDVRLSDIKTVLSAVRENLNAIRYDVGATAVSYLTDLSSSLSTFRTNFVDKINSLREDFVTMTRIVKEKIVIGLDTLNTSVSDMALSISNSFNFNTNNSDNDKIGVEGGLGWFGHSYDFFGEYGVGLLVAGLILKQFTDMHYFNSLITIGLSIGLVAVFFGIFLNVAQSDSAKSKQNSRASARVSRGG